MADQFTPGPWLFDAGDEGDSSVGMGGWMPYVYAEEPNAEQITICTMHLPSCRVEPDPTGEWGDGIREAGNIVANARLIAAAPELLEALRRCEVSMDTAAALGVRDLLAPAYADSWAAAHLAARAAIRRATGE